MGLAQIRSTCCRFSFYLALLFSFLLCACSATKQAAPRADRQASTQKIDHHLTMGDAMERSQRVSNVRYNLKINLDASEFFNVENQIRFVLRGTSQPLRLDIKQAEVSNLRINGHFLYPNYNGEYLSINPKLLQPGENLIELDTLSRHSTNGEGLHRFVDPIDAQIYLYSHFEPVAAQKVFALFDQPDLKAKFTLTVTAPAQWQVISAMKEESRVANGEVKHWHFPTTPPLSPYNFSLHAGPYKSWQDNTGPYPMRLFARQSIAERVTAKDWFTYTKQGLKFFDNYFGIAYPFEKYDQLLVPEFLYGAMENAAAVTFSEDRFLSSSPISLPQKQRIASVILHEMAHQWFGDLVTMKWWNGLWLNESFASFMGTMATSEATEFSHVWRSFYSKGKQSAYRLDSLVTTHPIEVPVVSTANAFDNIDAITYSKGAAVLSQLRHLLGNEVFQEGVKHYLKTYSYANAELNDFISSLAKTAKRDLSHWQQDWLYSAGVNTLRVELKCQQGFIEKLALLQLPASKTLPTLREQKVQLALFSQRYSGMERYHLQTVTYSGRRTEFPELRGAKCPDLVYPNYQDWGYVKVELDPISFATAQADLNQIQDPLLRSMLWQSLWDSVTSGHLSLKQYIGAILVNAPNESDLQVLQQIIASLHQTKAYLDRFDPTTSQTLISQAEIRQKSRYKKIALKALEQMSLRKTIELEKQSEHQTLWFNAHIELANSQSSLDYLVQLLSGQAEIKGVALTQDVRWRIIHTLNRYDHPKAKRILAKEQKQDVTDTGAKAALAAKISRPEARLKRDYLSQLLNANQPVATDMGEAKALNFAQQRLVMENLYPADQTLLSRATTELRLENLATLEHEQGPSFMRYYTRALLPKTCNSATLAAYEKTLEAQQTYLSAGTIRLMKETSQKIRMCIAIHQKL